jgi:hypothetical protein
MYVNDNTNSEKKPFDIRNFTDKLSHVNGEKYICPVCGGNNLSISKKNGAYKCWNGCQEKDIRAAVAPPEDNTKPVRTAATTEFFYNDRQGKRLVKVTRIDDGKGHKKFPQSAWDGKKWQSNLEGLDRSKIPCYRYQEVRKAIAQGNPIFLTEGEGKTDALWRLGIAATTFMGGSKNYRNYGNYRQDLEGAKLVLCPDRDVPGLKYMEEISEDYPDSQWLYAPPSEFFWSHLQQNSGLDVKNWIEDGATAEQILEAVGQKKDFKIVASTATTSAKVVSHPNFAQPNIKEIGGDIDKLVEQDLRRTQLLIAFSELAQKYKMAENAISKIYYTQIEELDKDDAKDDVEAKIKALLSAQKQSLKLSEIFPEKLAKPIETLASMLNLRPECFAIALLTQASALFKIGTETLLFEQTNRYRCTPNYFGAVVAEISQKKTPIFRAMITDPMMPLLQAARNEYNEKMQEYEHDLAKWKANKKESGAEPIKPRARVYSFSKATGESIPLQVRHFPLQSLLWTTDELAGILKSANQYRGGKGSDEEDLLEYWNGGVNGTRVLRADGLRVDLDRIYLSLFGTIQPTVLANFLEKEDKNGKFARFDFVLQPMAACKLSLDMPTIDLSPMMTDLYTKIDRLPVLNFELSPEASKHFLDFYNDCEIIRTSENTEPAEAGLVGKQPEKVGKLMTILHTIKAVFEGREVPLEIGVDSLLAAIAFTKFTESQIRLLRAKNSDSKELAPNLVEVIKILARKGELTVRETVYSFSSRNRPATSLAKKWLAELLSIGYVTVENEKFRLTEKAGSFGSFGCNPSPVSDRPWFKIGSNEPDLVHFPKNMNQMNQNEPVLNQALTHTAQAIQPNEPNEPRKNQNQKNANVEIADSVTVGTSATSNPLESGEKPKNIEAIVPDAVPVAIADLSKGDRVVTAAGITIAKIATVTSQNIYFHPMPDCDKVIERGLEGVRRSGKAKTQMVATIKNFKKWIEVARLKLLVELIEEPVWEPGQKLKLKVNGQMQCDVVELIDYKYGRDGSLKAIVNWMGKPQAMALDKLTEAT